jgi:hypothetical protein
MEAKAGLTWAIPVENARCECPIPALNFRLAIRHQNMRRSRSFLVALVSVCAALPAAAQSPQRPPKPYAPVVITLPAASDDASFIAFRAALAAAAKSRIYAELGPLVLAQGFFWGRDFGHKFDPRKPSVDNLAAAVALESRDGLGWDTLAAFAALDAVEPLDSRPGVVCAPARPGYDSVAFSKLLDVTYTTGIDWAYPRADDTPVHSAPQPGAARLGTLGLSFVRLLGFEGADSESAPGRTQWARVAMSDGKPGFVAPGRLMSLTAERLCYIKDPIRGWRIAGYIAGGN